MHKIIDGSFRIFEKVNPIHLSLEDLVGGKLELIDFINRLFLCQSEEVSSLDKLASRIQSLPRQELVKMANINGSLIRNLIMKQFPRPELDSLRELIANAMDANARAGRAQQPIHITIHKDRLSIQDSGDGIGNILNFFIPGRSGNAETLFNVEAGMENVTGRFGQGALSGFYYLYPNDSAYSSKPKFHFHETGATLSFICCISEKPHEVIITASMTPNGIYITHCQNPLDKIGKRSLTIHTKHQDRCLKIKFIERFGNIYLDMMEKPKKKVGTIIKIQSPMIEENENKLLSHISKVFKSSQFPLLLNGKPIHEQILRKINFQGGILTFTPIHDETKQGTLRICECGKLIADFDLTNFLTPGEVTIDFKRLNLSQERASLDFNSPQTISEMHDLIEKIVHQPEFTGLEQSALLNALSPLIGAKQFNLTKKIQTIVKESIEKATCDDQSINPEKNTLNSSNLKTKPQTFELETYVSLNPAYLSFVDLPLFYEAKSFKMYLGTGCLDQPISVIEQDGQFHLFLNEQLMPLNARSVFEFNCTLVNLWLKNKGYAFCIDIFAISKQKFSVPFPTDEVSQLIQIEPVALDMDWSKYDLNEKIPEEKYIPYFIEMFPKYAYPDDKKLENGMRGFLLRDEQSKLYRHFYSIPEKDIEYYVEKRLMEDMPRLREVCLLNIDRLPDKVHYLADLFFSKDERFTQIATLIYPKFMQDLFFYASTEVCYIASAALYNFLNQSKEGLEHVIIFLDTNLLDALPYEHKIDNSTQFLEIFNKQIENYQHLKQIVTLSGCQNPTLIGGIFKNYKSFNYERISKLKLLAERLADTESANLFIENLPYIFFHDFLITLSKEHLIRFFEVCPKLWYFQLENYLHTHQLSLRNDLSVSQLRKWMNIYAFVSKIGSISEMDKTGYLLPLIETYIDEEAYSTFEELDLLEQALNSLKGEISNVANSIRKLNIIITQDSELPPLHSSQARQERLCDLLKNRQGAAFHPIPNFTIEESFKWVDHQRKLKAESKDCQTQLAEIYRELWEKCGILDPLTRPFVYAVLLKGNANLLSENFIWPIQWNDSAIWLHDDPDLTDILGSAELAKRRLQGAMRQTLQENFFIKELCKNSREAHANEISFEVHSDEEKNTILVIRDNGVGMDLEGLKVLKTPNISSKNQNGEDPNFGWGFYTVFRDFDELLITTSKDGKNSFQLALKKTDQGILRQYLPTETAHPRGTTITLKSKNDPLLNLIKLHAEVVSSCKYLEEVNILFQGAPIYQGVQSEVFQEEKIDDICVQLGKGEGGIYGKDILLGPITSKYTDFLPEPLKELFTSNQLKMRIFLQHARQTMNRSHLVVDESFLLKIRMLVAKASFNYFIKQWTEEDKDERRSFFDILSEDYWNDFRFYDSLPTKEILSIFNTINNKQEVSKKYFIQCHLINYTRNFLSQMKNHHALNSDGAMGFNELEAALFHEQKKEIEKTNRKRLQLLEDKYKDPSAFASLLVHYPINENGMTFTAIRSTFKQFLCEKNILLLDGNFDSDYIQTQSSEQIKNILDKILKQVSLKFDYPSHKIVNKMAKAIYDRLLAINSQSLPSQSIDTTWHEKVLKEFLQKAARYLGKEIEVKFYAAQDGANAYTIRSGCQIFFNRCQYVKKFTEFAKPDQKISIEQLDFLDFLSTMLQTLAHELVHLEEERDCQNTHDQHFRKQLAIKLQKLFVYDDLPNSILDLFQETYNSIN